MPQVQFSNCCLACQKKSPHWAGCDKQVHQDTMIHAHGMSVWAYRIIILATSVWCAKKSPQPARACEKCHERVVHVKHEISTHAAADFNKKPRNIKCWRCRKSKCRSDEKGQEQGFCAGVATRSPLVNRLPKVISLTISRVVSAPVVQFWIGFIRISLQIKANVVDQFISALVTTGTKKPAR